MGASKPILFVFLALKPSVLGTKVCPYELILHSFKEENCIDTLSFIEKSFKSGKIGKKIESSDFLPLK